MSADDKIFTAACIVSELIAENLEDEMDTLDDEDKGVVQMLVEHLRSSQQLYAYSALRAMHQRTIH